MENHEHRVPGTCVAVTMEGRRPMLAEVQALVTRSALERPRRTTSGLDGSRVAMILAVLQQHCRVSLIGQDVFVSTVGGARLTEPATDLAIAVALASAGTGAAPPQGVVALGEISLAGEVRKVRDLPQRIAEAARLGFRVAVVPMAAGRSGAPGRSRTVDGMTVLETPDLAGALRLLEMTPARSRPAPPQPTRASADGSRAPPSSDDGRPPDRRAAGARRLAAAAQRVTSDVGPRWVGP